jgi:hypothetical protein
MARLEELTPRAMVKGILPEGLITVIQAKWHGSNVVELTYKDISGNPRCELLYRDREPILEIASVGLPWSFDADGKFFSLVSEARRIRMAYLFDPLLAVNTSLVDPLPHQITAVYAEMLTRQPLRFLLADDPGAGKTIMAGLLIKELLVRGDLHRCLICAPGSLVEQIDMRTVMQAEARQGYQPRDVSRGNCGYDIESRRPDTEPQEGGRLRFIEVKGRASGADTITITKNEILTGLNKPDDLSWPLFWWMGIRQSCGIPESRLARSRTSGQRA